MTTSRLCPKCGQRNSALNDSCIACDAGLVSGARPSAADETEQTVRMTAPPVPSGSVRLGEGGQISHYRLLNVLGAGGMGEVYRAYDEKLDRLVAVKVIRLDHLARLGPEERDEEVRRFVDEAQLTGRLDHPNICPIYELGEGETGMIFFAMKLVEGKTLASLWDSAGAARLLPERLAGFLGIFLKICDALAFAHDKGIVHRDIKPVNVMVGEFGEVYLMDWGAALLKELARAGDAPKTRLEVYREKSSFGSVVGTLRYMSPEQAQGRREDVDERSDVFSVGATLYHLLAGEAPYTAQDVQDLLRQAQHGWFPALGTLVGGQVPPLLVQVATKAMAMEPDERYQSVGELKKALEQFLHGDYQRPQRSFPKGSRIVVQGDEGDSAYVIVDGRCAVVDESGEKRTVLRVLGPGEVFGETAVFLRTLRTATVEALDDVKVTVVTRDTMTTGLGLNSWLGDFVTALADRFHDVDQKLRRQQKQN